MDFKKIFFYVFIIIVIFSLYKWLFRDSTTVNILDMQSAKKPHTKKLKSGGSSVQFAYSFWIYVTGWEYRLNDEKIIVERKGADADEPCPKIALAKNVNDLEITLATSSNSGSSVEPCKIRNIPLQKWTHIVVTTNIQSMDTYIDGKLVKTCLLKGPAKINAEADILVSSASSSTSNNNGFDGNIAKLRYYPRTLNPREVYELYKEGPQKGLFGNLFNKYKLKFQYLVDNEVQGTLTI